MKLFEFTSFLLEYNRGITTQKLGDKLIAAAQLDGKQDVDTILDTLERIDPTKHKQYVEWLSRQYIAKQFRLEDATRVNDVLVKFENIKRKLPQKDINKYTFYSLDDAIDKAYEVELKSDEPVNKTEQIPGVKVLYDGPLGNLSIPETEAASQYLGKGTKWCTAASKNCMFSDYNQSSPLYVWRDKNGKKYQFHFESLQFMDDKDRPIDDSLLQSFRTKHPVTSKLFKKWESNIATEPYAAMRYARNIIKSRWPEAENTIATDPYAAMEYAAHVIKGRWPEIEESIASDPYTAMKYARNVIKGRWPEIEKAIASKPTAAMKYARDVIKGRWPEAEKTIASDSYTASEYRRFLASLNNAGTDK